MSIKPEQPDADQTELEKRSLIPKQLISRRLFDRYAYLKHRYSFDLLSDQQGALDHAKIQEFLTLDSAELKSQSALISLLMHLNLEPGAAEKKHKIGCYKLVDPTLKQLNDIYLGPEQTDDFINELHEAIRTVLGEHAATVLQVTFKSGHFIIDMSQHKDGENHHDLEETLPDKMAKIAEEGRRILLNHVSDRLALLKEKPGTEEMEIHLHELAAALLKRKRFVDIAFGFDDLHDISPESAFMALRNSECSANIATINGNGNGNGHNGNGNGEKLKVKNYSHTDMITAGLDAIQAGSIALDEEGNVKQEWSEFFTLDKKTQAFRMNKQMIATYRRLDKYRKSKEYKDMTDEQKTSFEEKIKVFDLYYKKMNIIDVLKNFVYENFEVHLERVKKIAGLLEETENFLEAGAANMAKGMELLDAIDEELRTSIKGDGSVPIGNTRSLVRTLIREHVPELMSENKMIMVYTDIIGLGPLNQSAYESSIQNLISMLGITDDEWSDVIGDKAKTRAMIESKVKTIQDTPEFRALILGIGDEGTRHIRENDRYLNLMLSGKPVINAEGGDEKVALYTEKNECYIPDEAVKLEDKLLDISEATKTRVAAVMGDFSLSPMPDYDPKKDIGQLHRTEITRLLRMQRWAEEALREVKYWHERRKLIVKVTTVEDM